MANIWNSVAICSCDSGAICFFRIAAVTLFVCHATTATSKKQTLCLNLCYFRWIILTFPRVNIRLFCIQRMSVSGTEPSTSQLMLYSMSDANCFGFDVIFMDVGLTVEYNNTIMNILIEVKRTHIREQKYLLEIIYLIKRFFLQFFWQFGDRVEWYAYCFKHLFSKKLLWNNRAVEIPISDVEYI